MREIIILALIAAVGYLAYDDYYKQRPALQQAQAEIQQLRQNPAPVAGRYMPVNPPRPPAWFQKKVQQGSSLDSSRQHIQHGERASTPEP
jgi:hypothetical protein